MSAGSMKLLTAVMMVVAALAVGAAPATAAPDGFDILWPGDEEFVDTRTPTFIWEATTADRDFEYQLFAAGDLTDPDLEPLAVIDPTTCSDVCAYTPSEALPDLPSYDWEVWAVDDQNAATPSTSVARFRFDLAAPVVTQSPVSPARRTDTCPPTPDYQASDARSGVDSVEYEIDGAPAPTTCSLSHGPHVLTVIATDRAGNSARSSQSFRTDVRKATVRIVAHGPMTPGAYGAFEAVVDLDAATPPIGYRWSSSLLPARDTWSEPSEIRLVYPLTALQPRTITVTIRDADNEIATATTSYAPFAPPPPGLVGFTVNGGARYTNRRNVRLQMVWPQGAGTYTVTPSTFRWPQALRPEVIHRLGGTGTVRKATEIRVQFDGLGGANNVHTRSIVLDLERPRILRLFRRGGGRLRADVKDSVSGVSLLQYARRQERPFPRSRFAATTTVPPGARWVRAWDRAGNVSQWKRVPSR